MNRQFEQRLRKVEETVARRKPRGLSHQRRKFLTDRAVLHGDQDALAELNRYRPEKITASSEQRDAAVAAGLRASM
jgi:hypothetical protein